MKILLTGGTGYIAQRLLPLLLGNGHEVICCVRDRARFDPEKYRSTRLSVLEVDFLKPDTLQNIPSDIDAAYYLIHSMSTSTGDFEKLEETSAINFKNCIQQTKARQVIYLSGIVNEEILSKHLTSRRNVERMLGSGSYSLTTLRAGIIIGSGSASFEIIRDLVEKLPIMIAPRWLDTRTQPIAVRNVIEFISGVLLNETTFNKSYDIGGPDIMTYKQMLLRFAKVRGLRRWIGTVPVMTPKLSSYWLYFITSTSYSLAQNLVDSMKVEVICKENNLKEILGIVPVNYETAISEAFEKIELNQVPSSWKDALTSNTLNDGISRYAEVPVNGCYFDNRNLHIDDREKVLKKIWIVLFVIWGLPLTFYRSKFRKIVYQTDKWTINIKPYFMKELKALFGNIYPDNKNYLKFRNFYRFYLIIYLLLFTSYLTFSQKNNMNEIKIGSSIPAFTLPDQNGNLFDINSVRGKKNLVIYFYPKDDSPGCTEEACSFRDQFEVFKEADAVIIGISGQSVESHKEFAEKHRLSFTLLSDEENKIRKQFGVTTNFLGLIPGRVTYIADKTGKVIYIFNSQIQATRHVDEALRILKELK